MGSVTPYATADGKRYRVRYRTPDRRQTDKRGFRTKRDAELFLASVEVAKHRGEYIAPADARITVGELATPWLASKESRLKPSSYAPLKASWTNYVEQRWGSVPVSSIRYSDVQAWVDGIKMSPTVVIRAFGILAGILDVAVKDKRINVNPARQEIELPRKRSKRKHRYLTHAQLVRLAEHSGKHGTLVLVLGWCGLRWGEAIELRVSDLDLLRKRISVARAAIEVDGEIHVDSTKSDEARSVPIPSTLVDLLARRCAGRERDDLLFDDGHGFHMRRTRASKDSRSWFKTALVRASLEPMTLHDLRHTAASLAVAAGANVKAIQRMLGHASAAMTLDIYSDLFDDDLDALSMRLDQAIASSNVGKVWAGQVA